ncbi:LAFE_0B04566g1_1 [Lachancea fermentati]|uniref:LAFE_0B04566g1_1 n=1 Tax=Lachancea fermentati TaxID=4955 RepID=A0A1G4M7Q8_LACFM|nr:LAFE_0B04566g1_1 [Lachancea fermentati]
MKCICRASSSTPVAHFQRAAQHFEISFQPVAPSRAVSPAPAPAPAPRPAAAAGGPSSPGRRTRRGFSDGKCYPPRLLSGLPRLPPASARSELPALSFLLPALRFVLPALPGVSRSSPSSPPRGAAGNENCSYARHEAASTDGPRDPRPRLRGIRCGFSAARTPLRATRPAWLLFGPSRLGTFFEENPSPTFPRALPLSSPRNPRSSQKRAAVTLKNVGTGYPKAKERPARESCSGVSDVHCNY